MRENNGHYPNCRFCGKKAERVPNLKKICRECKDIIVDLIVEYHRLWKE